MSEEATGGTSSTFRIPFKNSCKFPKDMRPPHLQDDDIFNALSIESVTNQLAIWSQTKATQEATALKAKKSEKIIEGNTPIKTILIKEGEDDATSKLHPQRYHLRPCVSGQGKIWSTYPMHWPEVFFLSILLMSGW